MIRDRLTDYERMLKAARSAKTVECYMQGLAHFFQFLGPMAVTPSTTTEFMSWASENRKWKPGTTRLYVTAVRSFLTFCQVRGEAVPDQAIGMMPRMETRISAVISEGHLQQYMEAARTIPEPYATAILLLPLTGLRVSEMCHLRISDVAVKPPNGFDFILRGTKGKRDRVVPLLMAGVPVFKHYLLVTRARLPGDLWVFPSRQKKRHTHISVRSMEYKIGAIKKTLGIRHLTPHTMRHVYATVLERQGVSSLKIMQILGHRDINTTRTYVHLTSEDLRGDLDDVKTPWAETAEETIDE